jgi:putative oxygen-independent coproporphyrinogen III oxidase
LENKNATQANPYNGLFPSEMPTNQGSIWSQARTLYIHVPFCQKICPYCDFAVLSAPKRLQHTWLEGVKLELLSRLPGKSLKKHGPVFDSIYIGGGTPSALELPVWQNLLKFLDVEMGILQGLREFAVEANPESVYEGLLDVWQNYGVTRISVGVQSLQDDVLKYIGRNHGAQQAVQAVETLLGYSFQINVDFIFGLPQQTVPSFLEDLKQVMNLNVNGHTIDHISFYGLSIEHNTLFAQWFQNNKIQQSELYDEFYEQGVQFVLQKGFVRYEVSNFSKPGLESFHNQVYWHSGEWLGVGPGAHSFFTNSTFWGMQWQGFPVRSANHRHLKKWLQWVQRGCLVQGQEYEILTQAQSLQEKIWLGLRTARGIPQQALYQEFGKNCLSNALETYLEKQFLIVENGYICVQGKGWLFLDEIAVALVNLGD